MTADDAWGGNLEGAPARELQSISAPASPTALAAWAHQLDSLESYATGLAQGLEGALSALGELATDDARAVELIARVRAVRATLGTVEATATRWAGQSPFVSESGTLADGTFYQVQRGRDRKAWAHDEWKHDVRAAVLKRAGLEGHDVVDAATGELVDLQGLLTWVQEQHGSTAPRVTALRTLGLDPDDYCETFPGLWNVTLSKPEDGSPEQ